MKERQPDHTAWLPGGEGCHSSCVPPSPISGITSGRKTRQKPAFYQPQELTPTSLSGVFGQVQPAPPHSASRQAHRKHCMKVHFNDPYGPSNDCPSEGQRWGHWGRKVSYDVSISNKVVACSGKWPRVFLKEKKQGFQLGSGVLVSLACPPSLNVSIKVDLSKSSLQWLSLASDSLILGSHI